MANLRIDLAFPYHGAANKNQSDPIPLSFGHTYGPQSERSASGAMMRVRSRFSLALLALTWCGSALADVADKETAYTLAAEHVQKHSDNFWLDGSEEGDRALDRAWNLLAEWTAAYLNEHPGATPKRVKRAAPGGDLQILPLGPRTMLVSANVGDGFGTIFIVDGTRGAFHPVWSIRQRAGREAFPRLDAWTAKGATEDCRKAVGDVDWGRCGPLQGNVARLPDDAQGHPRFYVEATYAQMAETTVGAQISFWTWTGSTAEPQFVKRYTYNFEDQSTRFKDGKLTIRSTDYYRSFFSCGTCIGRQMNWSLRVGPQQIEDLGAIPVIPELDALDELLARAARHQPADDLAAPEVITLAASVMDGAYHDNTDHNYISAGMMEDTSVRPHGERTLVCLQTDDAGTFKLTMERRGAGFFISNMTVSPDGPNCPHDKP
jgi:hypothetical protein